MPDTVGRAAPRIAFLYARDEAHRGGGADARADVLRSALAGVAVVDDILVGEHCADAGIVTRLAAAAGGVPPRLSQQLDLQARRGLLGRLEAADLVVAATTFSLPYVPRRLRGRTVLDAHNVESAIVRQLAEHAASAPRRLAYRATQAWTSSWERRVARQVAQVWAVSEDEAAWFRDAGARSVVLVPNGVHIPAEPGPRPRNQDVVFVASFGSLFNREAFRWFADEVWPQVLAGVPTARLLLAGRASEELTGPGVTGLGYVDDLTALYARARLAIAPLRSGGGTRLKIVEGLAHGVPVVSTTIGAEGLRLRPGQDYLLADEPQEFARSCVSLLTDDGLCERVATSGRTAVVAAYGWDRIGEVAAAAALDLVAGLR